MVCRVRQVRKDSLEHLETRVLPVRQDCRVTPETVDLLDNPDKMEQLDLLETLDSLE